MKSKAKQISTTVKRFGLDELDTERVTTVLCEDGSIWSRSDLESQWTEELPAFTGVQEKAREEHARKAIAGLEQIRSYLRDLGYPVPQTALDVPLALEAILGTGHGSAPPPTTSRVVVCPDCGGSGIGARRGFFTEVCKACDGGGRV